MKPKLYSYIFIITVSFIINKTSAQENDIRPVRDNVGFCWYSSEMDTLMNYIARTSENIKQDDRLLIGGISPHDDYLYAGKVYFPLYKMIRTKEVVVFGVTHGTVRQAMNNPKNVLILDDYRYWKGPYQNVEISPLRELIKSKLNKNFFMVSDKAQNIEHSIEALVPFLQYYNRDIRITPIMVTQMSFERMDSISTALAEIIKDYITSKNLQPGKDIFFLISTDADHYGEDFNNSPFGMDDKAHQEATMNDTRIADTYLNAELTYKDIDGLKNELWGSPEIKTPVPLWCGKFSIPFGLLAIYHIANDLNLKNLKGKFLKYSDSWTEKTLPVFGTHMGTTAPFSLKHWCGYVAAGVYVDK